MNASTIIADAGTILNDDLHNRWPVEILLGWLDEAQTLVVPNLPDMCAKFNAFQVTAGDVRQKLSSGTFKLIDVVRNLGADGNTAGGPILFMTMGELNSAYPSWTHAAPADTAQVWSLSDAVIQDGIFYLYPAPLTDYYVEIYATSYPTTLTALTDDISVPDLFRPVLTDWVVFRSLEQNAPHGDISKAAHYQQSALAVIGSYKPQPEKKK